MKTVRRFLNRFRSALFARSTDSDLAEEVESHIQLQTEENGRAGMTLEEARRAAVLKFGAAQRLFRKVLN
jgi:hypothetical protein